MAKEKRDLSKLLAAAKADSERASKVWKPAPGDSIAGTVSKMRYLPGKGLSDDGKKIKYLSVTLADQNGELIVVPCGMILQDLFEEKGIMPGDDVAIFYKGKEPTGSGQKVGIYSLATNRE